jgi:hypothetical protein
MTEELNSVLWSGIPGTIALVLSRYLAGWAGDMFLFLGMVLVLFAVVILFFGMRDTWIDQNRRIAESKDRIYQLAEQARFLSPEQIQFVQAAAHIGIDYDLLGEQFMRNTDAPLWFVAELLSKSFNDRIYPIRSYSEGSDKSLWAQQITSELVKAGFATEHLGNHSALWVAGITPNIIAKKLHIELEQPLPHPDNYSPLPEN